MTDRRDSTVFSKKSAAEVVLVTDCGSTTTKAVLFESGPDGWRQTFRGEAPTTVEKPVNDVTIGALNAFLEVQELSARKIVQETFTASAGGQTSPFFFRKDSVTPSDGIDLYLSTSSAGGGLQMAVAGVVGNMSAQSAERAALGAGAIVMETISLDDGREVHERVKRIRHVRPDIILLAGGTEGGTVNHPLELAETILQAAPRPRFGDTLKTPVIYAANSRAREEAGQILAQGFAFTAVENLRPSLEEENLAPARDAIHELFLQHVMSHAPGYNKLMQWTPRAVLPTPKAVGDMIQLASQRLQKQILAVDIGGATTDVFSVFWAEGEQQKPVFNRTVSANLGMSYSVANVLIEAGEENIQRWLPFDLPLSELRDRLANKMIRPTSIPQTKEDLLVEQAVCREALRLALEHHQRLAVGLSGTRKERSIKDMFSTKASGEVFDLMKLDLIIGSGGVLSHAPSRASALLMMVDAYQPLGVTELAVDSIFMLPHLGVLASVNEEAAIEVLLRDCLLPLGTVIAPSSSGPGGRPVLKVELASGEEFTLKWGELKVLPLASGLSVEAKLKPLLREVDLGAGPGRERNLLLSGGEVGLVFDCRGRPLRFSQKAAERQAENRQHQQSLGISL